METNIEVVFNVKPNYMIRFDLVTTIDEAVVKAKQNSNEIEPIK
jgi:hypothetical protein